MRAIALREHPLAPARAYRVLGGSYSAGAGDAPGGAELLLRRGRAAARTLRFAGAELREPAAGLPAAHRRVAVLDVGAAGGPAGAVAVVDLDTMRTVLVATGVALAPAPAGGAEGGAPPA